MKKKLNIEGMSCDHCVMRITNALKEIEGVRSVDVNLQGGFALVDLSADVEDSKVEKAVDEAGYDLISIEIM